MVDRSKAGGGVAPRHRSAADSVPHFRGRTAVRRCALVSVVLAMVAASASGQPPAPTPAPGNKEPPANTGTTPKRGKPKVFDFTGLDISGRLRTPQLLYFLDRASEELERASLERRSFIPEMVRSVDEGKL